MNSSERTQRNPAADRYFNLEGISQSLQSLDLRNDIQHLSAASSTANQSVSARNRRVYPSVQNTDTGISGLKDAFQTAVYLDCEVLYWTFQGFELQMAPYCLMKYSGTAGHEHL